MEVCLGLLSGKGHCYPLTLNSFQPHLLLTSNPTGSNFFTVNYLCSAFFWMQLMKLVNIFFFCLHLGRETFIHILKTNKML